ncbi:MAG: hypothetical protein AAF491_04790 [Verrucomicrobiota bacterium]
MKRLALFAGLGLLAASFTGCTTVDNESTTASVDPNAPSSFQKTAEADRKARETGTAITPYPFDTCAVQFHKGFKNGKPKHRRVYQGQEVLFCCTPCVRAFDMAPDAYMPRIRAAVTASADTTGSGL